VLGQEYMQDDMGNKKLSPNNSIEKIKPI